MDKTLTFTFLIRVIVDPKPVSIGIEGELLYIAKPVGKYFEVATIRITAHDTTLIGVVETLSILRYGIDPLVPNRPVDLSVGPHNEPVHIVTTISNMQAVAR